MSVEHGIEIVNSGGISTGSLLLVLFIGLKLTGYISWSWWWVLCPLWIPLSLIGTVVMLGGIAWAINTYFIK